MKKDKRMIVSIIWVVLGTVLIALAFAEKVDVFWNGMGSGLLIVGALNLLRQYRFSKNEAYREKIEIEEKDERNQFIRNKTWAWTGYLFVIIAAILCIVFKIIGQEVLSFAASGAVCLILVLYWISYFILRKKY
jgi:uncharacterized BrkB/YihY/UPF0761 family membrane protein